MVTLMTVYDAFISYSHAKDKPIAAALQSVIQKLGKPWYRRRALRVFRDDTSLSATPNLWPTIQQALENSRYLILFASPEAASSKWVDDEVEYWANHKSVDTLLLALTDGALVWDRELGDFRRPVGVPLPPALEGRFRHEPMWIDLTAYRDRAELSDTRLLDLGAAFAATIRGILKEDLLSQEVREQRRTLTVVWSAAGVLLILLAVAVLQKRAAEQQRDRAEKTLTAATQSANDLVLKVAVKIRETTGMPIDLVREILRRARDLQEQLSKYNENDVGLRRSQAIALRESSQTLLLQGDGDAALKDAQQSRVIVERLLTADPANPDLRHDLSFSLNRIGEVLARAERDEEALAAFSDSLEIRKTLAESSDAPEAQRDLALSYERIADALLKLGRREKAIEAYRESQAIRERLARSEPDKPERKADLATSYDRLGKLLDGQPEEALDAYRKAQELREGLVAADPRNTNWLRALAATYDDIGNILLASGQLTDALDHYRKAYVIRRGLVEKNPDIPLWRANLAISLYNLARAGDHPAENYAQALAIVRALTAEQKLPADLREFEKELTRRLAETRG